MSLTVWLPEGIHEEFNITSEPGKTKQILSFPYKWFHLDIFNEGPDAVKVMINGQSLPQANELKKLRGREYDAKHPKYWRVAIYQDSGLTASTVKIATTR